MNNFFKSLTPLMVMCSIIISITSICLAYPTRIPLHPTKGAYAILVEGYLPANPNKYPLWKERTEYMDAFGHNSDVYVYQDKKLNLVISFICSPDGLVEEVHMAAPLNQGLNDLGNQMLLSIMGFGNASWLSDTINSSFLEAWNTRSVALWPWPEAGINYWLEMKPFQNNQLIYFSIRATAK